MHVIKKNSTLTRFYSEHRVLPYCYGNDLISFNIKNDKTKVALTHMYIELVISKPTKTSVWAETDG